MAKGDNILDIVGGQDINVALFVRWRGMIILNQQRNRVDSNPVLILAGDEL